jgi:3',5'-cyclic AMP phosphodiesterase CpdA
MRFREFGLGPRPGKFIVAVILLLCLFPFGNLALAAPESNHNTARPDHLILSWTEDPLTTQTISWRTGADISPNSVQYLPAAEFGDCFSFLYMGDVQDGYDVWGKMLEQVATENPELKFALLGGDLVDKGNSSEEWQQFFAAAWPVFKELPLMPAVGNHDDTTLFRKYFAVPLNGPEGYEGTIYSFDYGNCHITVLNSNSMGIPGTYDYDKIAHWLKQDLAASQQTWKLVVCHHPPYQVVQNWRGEHLQTNWVPLFEQGGVDMVFSGHQHVYMRTKPLREGKIQPDGQGIVYVIGNAGTKYYGPGPDYDYIAKQLAWVSNYQVIEIDGDTLTMTAKDADGQLIDSYTLVKKPPDIAGANTWASDYGRYFTQWGLLSRLLSIPPYFAAAFANIAAQSEH